MGSLIWKWSTLLFPTAPKCSLPCEHKNFYRLPWQKSSKSLKERTKQVSSHSLCWPPQKVTPWFLFELELHEESNDIIRTVHSYRALSRFYSWHCFSVLVPKVNIKRKRKTRQCFISEWNENFLTHKLGIGRMCMEKLNQLSLFDAISTVQLSVKYDNYILYVYYITVLYITNWYFSDSIYLFNIPIIIVLSPIIQNVHFSLPRVVLKIT